MIDMMNYTMKDDLHDHKRSRLLSLQNQLKK